MCRSWSVAAASTPNFGVLGIFNAMTTTLFFFISSGMAPQFRQVFLNDAEAQPAARMSGKIRKKARIRRSLRPKSTSPYTCTMEDYPQTSMKFASRSLIAAGTALLTVWLVARIHADVGSAVAIAQIQEA